jgi:Sulfotransferase domain
VASALKSAEMTESASKLSVVSFLGELFDRRWFLRRLAESKIGERPVALVLYSEEPPDVAQGMLEDACRKAKMPTSAVASEIRFVQGSSTDGGAALGGEPVGIFSLFAQRGSLSRLPRFTSGRVLGKYINRLEAVEKQAFPPRPPDFVGVGVQKAGTTWWTKLLREHPRIDVPVKEVHFFDGLNETAVEDCPTDLYARLFRRPPNALSGEFTPGYIYWPWVPKLLHAAVPGAKLIVMLRDPVERYRSGLAQEVQRGHKVSDSMRERNKRRGFYAEQLERLFEYFDREQVLVLQYEKCAAAPLRYYRETLRFLGLRNSSFAPPSLRKKVHRTKVQKVELDQATRSALAAEYRDDAARVAELVPEIDVSLWKNLA